MAIFKKAISGLLKGIRRMDLYGKTINLQYRGDDVFKTYLGGTATIFVILILLGYATYLLRIMFGRETVIYSTNTVIRDLTKDFQDHNPAEHGFAIALGIRFSDTSFLDEEYLKMFQVKAYQYSAKVDTEGNWNETYEELELVRCQNNFPYENITLLHHFKINNYVCIKPKNYSIAGNWYTDESKAVQIEVSM